MTEPRASAPAQADAPGEARWAALAGVFGLALGLRLVHLALLRDAPFFAMPMGDGRVFDAWARELAAGDWIGTEVFFQAPLYPYLLGVLYRVGGAEPALALLVQSVLGALGCVLLAAAGARLMGRGAGTAAGLLLACYPAAIFYDGLIQKASLALVGVCALLFVASRLRVRPTALGFVGMGLLLGGLALTRENAVVLGVPLLLAIALDDRARPVRRAGAVALVLAGMIAMVLPAAVRNATLGEGFVVSTSNLGPNLYIGNQRGADGLYTPLVPGRSSPDYERADATAIAEERLGRAATPGEVSAFWVSEARSEIAADPAGWIVLMGRKLLLLHNRLEIGDTEDLSTFAEVSPVLGAFAPWLHFGTLLPLAVLGVWVRRRHLADDWPLLAMLALYGASVAAFFVMGRFRMPWVPLLALFAGAGLVGARAALGEAGPRARIAAVVLVAGVAVAANWPLAPRGDSRFLAHYNLGAALAERGDTQAAITAFQRAADAAPHAAEVRYNLGVNQARAGRLADGTRNLAEAVRLGSEQPMIRDGVAQMARILGEQARAAAAEGRRGQARALANASDALTRELTAAAEQTR